MKRIIFIFLLCVLKAHASISFAWTNGNPYFVTTSGATYQLWTQNADQTWSTSGQHTQGTYVIGAGGVGGSGAFSSGTPDGVNFCIYVTATATIGGNSFPLTAAITGTSPMAAYVPIYGTSCTSNFTFTAYAPAGAGIANLLCNGAIYASQTCFPGQPVTFNQVLPCDTDTSKFMIGFQNSEFQNLGNQFPNVGTTGNGQSPQNPLDPQHNYFQQNNTNNSPDVPTNAIWSNATNDVQQSGNAVWSGLAQIDSDLNRTMDRNHQDILTGNAIESVVTNQLGQVSFSLVGIQSATYGVSNRSYGIFTNTLPMHSDLGAIWGMLSNMNFGVMAQTTNYLGQQVTWLSNSYGIFANIKSNSDDFWNLQTNWFAWDTNRPGNGLSQSNYTGFVTNYFFITNQNNIAVSNYLSFSNIVSISITNNSVSGTNEPYNHNYWETYSNMISQIPVWTTNVSDLTNYANSKIGNYGLSAFLSSLNTVWPDDTDPGCDMKVSFFGQTLDFDPQVRFPTVCTFSKYAWTLIACLTFALWLAGKFWEVVRGMGAIKGSTVPNFQVQGMAEVLGFGGEIGGNMIGVVLFYFFVVVVLTVLWLILLLWFFSGAFSDISSSLVSGITSGSSFASAIGANAYHCLVVCFPVHLVFILFFTRIILTFTMSGIFQFVAFCFRLLPFG